MTRHHRRPVLGLAIVVLCLALSGAAVADPGQGLRGEYFDDRELGGSPLHTRVDAQIDFNWGLTEPVAGLGDTFGVRWTGTVTPRYSETYTLITTADDGVRLWVDDTLVIDDWTQHSVQQRSGTIALTAGQAHDLKLEYNDRTRHAVVKLEWRSASQVREVIPASRLAPPAAPATPPVVEPIVEPVVEPDPEPVVAPADPPAAPVIAATPPAPKPVVPAAKTVFDPPAAPEAGETFNAQPTAGEVLVRRPEDGALIPLQAGASLPVGTRVDARDGAVAVQTAAAEGVAMTNQYAEFRGARFKVGQKRKGSRVVDIDLQHGDFESCPRGGKAASKGKARAAGKSKSSKRVRAVWGSGKGRFRTRGRHAAATVRGTTWTVEDRCDATVTRVKEGVVDVEDFATGKTVTVRAGESYAARSKRSR